MADSDNESGGGNGGGGGCMDGSGEFSFPREQDRFLPIVNVSRIMKKALPGNAKISKDAKETVQECVSEFISFITGEASDKCQREKRKTINGDDLLWAMTTLGFEEYVDPLKVYLHKFREMEGEKVVVVVGSKEGGGGGGGSIVNMGGIEIAAGGGGYGGGMYGGGMVMGQMYDGSPPSSSSSSYHRQHHHHHHHQMSMGMGMAGSYVNGGGNGGNSSTSGPGGASVGATGNGGIGRQGS